VNRKHTPTLPIVRAVVALVLAIELARGAWAVEAKRKKPALKLYTDPEHVDTDFQFQGEYAGTVSQPGGGETRLGAQVRALGDGVFRTMFFEGGLPDLLVNNAATINRNASLWKVPAEKFSQVTDVNIKGVVEGCPVPPEPRTDGQRSADGGTGVRRVRPRRDGRGTRQPPRAVATVTFLLVRVTKTKRTNPAKRNHQSKS
jgi:NAD(P)-dependent dehydrogenase (short-subunit alcohol dehydrogenase family)